MEIYLDKRSIRQIRIAAQEAIEEGDLEALRDEIMDAFTEDQVDDVERHLDAGDFHEFLSDVLDEWNQDDVDELVELLETQLAEAGVDLKFENKSEDDEDEDEDEDEDDDDEDFEDDDEVFEDEDED